MPILCSCFGYLMKLSSGKGVAGKQWSKRWVVVRDDGSVVYYKSAKDSADAEADYNTIDLKDYVVAKALDAGMLPHDYAYDQCNTVHSVCII